MEVVSFKFFWSASNKLHVTLLIPIIIAANVGAYFKGKSYKLTRV